MTIHPFLFILFNANNNVFKFAPIECSPSSIIKSYFILPNLFLIVLKELIFN